MTIGSTLERTPLRAPGTAGDVSAAPPPSDGVPGEAGPAVAPVKRVLPEAWPAYVFLFGYGITWLLGFGEGIFIVLSVPMLGALIRKRRIKTPPGFGLWMLFLVWMVASGYMAGKNAPGLDVTNSSHYGSWAARALIYFSATIVLLYMLNTRREALPARTLVRGLASLFVLCVVGGYLGLLFRKLSFPTPLGLAPGVVQRAIGLETHPSVSQIQDVLGFASSRPSAPFAYTNSWGGNLSLFLPYFVLGWMSKGASLRRRIAAVVILVAALVPIVYSLNRGLWVNVAVALVAASVLLAARGHVRPLLAMLVAPLLLGLLVVATPLHSTISSRLAHGHSDTRRAGLAQLAFDGAKKSPILGWGTTRNSPGSQQSIAVGGSSSCKSCGTPPTGTHGHLYLLIFAQGFPGAALWFSFFLYSLWRYRRGRSPLYLTAAVALTVFICMTPYYNALSAPQFYVMAVIGVLARDERLSPEQVLAKHPA